MLVHQTHVSLHPKQVYRSPEVVLGLPYSFPIGMWSLSCIFAELHIGNVLFPSADTNNHMQMMVRFLGMVSTLMLEKSRAKTLLKNIVRGQGVWTFRQKRESSTDPDESSSSEAGEPIAPSTNLLSSLTKVNTAGARPRKHQNGAAYERNSELFIDLMYKMLAYEPEVRIKPHEALSHPLY